MEPGSRPMHNDSRSRPGPGRSAAAAAAILLVLAGPAAAREAPVRLTGVTYLGDVPTVLADRLGLFARRLPGMAVEYGVSGSGNLQRLRAGDTDFALMSLTPLVLDALADRSRGEAGDPVILASLVHSTRLNHVVTLPRSGITDPVTLHDGRIGLMKGTNAEFVWSLFARYHGFDADDARIIDVPAGRLSEALLADEIDAAVLREPWTSRLSERVDGELHLLPGANAYTAKWVVVARRGYVHEHADRARAVLRAYGESIRRLERRPREAMGLYARHADITVDTLRAHWAALDYGLSLDWSLVATLQQQLDWARRAGHAAAGVPPVEVLSLIADGPLRGVDPAAVGVPPAVRPAGDAAR